MNGIIHACTHPNDNDTSATLTQREMMLAIFRYIDRMVTEIAKVGVISSFLIQKNKPLSLSFPSISIIFLSLSLFLFPQ